MSKLEDILGIPCVQYYTDEYLERAIATARAEALRKAAERARNAIFDFGIGDKATNYYSPMIRRDLAAQLAEQAILAGKQEDK
jgi:hypothetical protein